jgi:hypothetical protein
MNWRRRRRNARMQQYARILGRIVLAVALAAAAVVAIFYALAP